MRTKPHGRNPSSDCAVVLGEQPGDVLGTLAPIDADLIADEEDRQGAKGKGRLGERRAGSQRGMLQHPGHGLAHQPPGVLQVATGHEPPHLLRCK